ncbi:Aste57867_19901 [Aphanomyces stellatus]|uniref:Aste57867_19901 protein n=1 Tax=Aphanomyces stellatus TaxID=120398 RepID=A0A485LEE0_9STRA|nr:hypothetical protein As57867_019835 [Aphanomyces stellatus]VFT96599.1 Aste57867_19901 [Aphanomyces stellatus]
MASPNAFRPTPSRQSGYFSVLAEDIVDAPASHVFKSILDLDHYDQWSTYATKATKLGAPGPLTAGATIVFRIHLDPSKPGEDTQDTVLLVEDLPECKRFVVASSPFPQWLLWAEKVQEVEVVSDTQCRLRKWISMGGPMAPLVLLLKGSVLQTRFNDYVRELKTHAEKERSKDN